MPTSPEQIVHDALALPVIERARLVESLLASLDRPDPRVDQLWAIEAENRLAEFHARGMGATTAEEVFGEFEA